MTKTPDQIVAEIGERIARRIVTCNCDVCLNELRPEVVAELGQG